MRKVGLLAVAGLLGLASGAAVASDDFGKFVENQLRGKSPMLFGVVGPLEASSTMSLTQAEAEANPTSLQPRGVEAG